MQISLRRLQVHLRMFGRVLEARVQGAPPQHCRVQGRAGKSLRHLQGNLGRCYRPNSNHRKTIVSAQIKTINYLLEVDLEQKQEIIVKLLK